MEEIRKLRSQLDSSSADVDIVRQRDALLQRIAVSNVLLLCRLLLFSALSVIAHAGSSQGMDRMFSCVSLCDCICLHSKRKTA